jgi:hypothetical protein
MHRFVGILIGDDNKGSRDQDYQGNQFLHVISFGVNS